jgi:hypothetical protein
MVFIAKQSYMFRPIAAIFRFSQLKLHVSAYIGHHQVFTTSLLKPDDGRYRPKHVVFVLFCYKYHNFSHIIVVFLTEIYPSL